MYIGTYRAQLNTSRRQLGSSRAAVVCSPLQTPQVETICAGKIIIIVSFTCGSIPSCAAPSVYSSFFVFLLSSPPSPSPPLQSCLPAAVLPPSHSSLALVFKSAERAGKGLSVFVDSIIGKRHCGIFTSWDQLAGSFNGRQSDIVTTS